MQKVHNLCGTICHRNARRTGWGRISNVPSYLQHAPYSRNMIFNSILYITKSSHRKKLFVRPFSLLLARDTVNIPKQRNKRHDGKRKMEQREKKSVALCRFLYGHINLAYEINISSLYDSIVCCEGAHYVHTFLLRRKYAKLITVFVSGIDGQISAASETNGFNYSETLE